MANQDVRYYLNGMSFEIENDVLKTVSTDGHRLAIAQKNTISFTQYATSGYCASQRSAGDNAPSCS
jgi:DNA polymerase III sliding clamp (beta) subunit (PCNA family)